MESKCSVCGKELPPESRFCLSCGSPVDSTASEAEPRVSLLHHRWLPAAFGAVCVLVAVMLVLMGGRNNVRNTPSGPAPANLPQVVSPVMPGDEQSSSDQAQPGMPPAQMPSTAGAAPAQTAVTDYLSKVQKIEEYRRTLYTELLQVDERERAAQSGGGTMPDALKKQVSAACSSFTRRSRQLGDYYKTIRPPSGYEEFAGTYDKALERSIWSMQRAYLELERGNPSSAGAVRSAYQPEVDDGLKTSDKALEEACRAAGVSKSVDILPDGAAANTGKQ